jgi:hypothetical protein
MSMGYTAQDAKTVCDELEGTAQDDERGVGFLLFSICSHQVLNVFLNVFPIAPHFIPNPSP